MNTDDDGMSESKKLGRGRFRMINYKCPQCGAYMIYNPAKKCLICEYCGKTEDIKVLSAEEQAELLQEAEASSEVWEETVTEETNGEQVMMRHYICKNCGAEIMTDENTAATMCGFCGNPTLIEDRLRGETRPAKVIPFSFSREEAIEKFRAWTKKGKLTPSVFSSSASLDKVTGLYVPYWIYDFDVDAQMQATATRVRHQRKGQYEYIYTDHFALDRGVEVGYERIPADASKKMPDDVMDRLEPFDYKEMVAFEMPYLSGFQADKYDYKGEELESRAAARASSYAETATRNTMNGYATVNVVHKNIRPKRTKMEYTMFPAWIVNYTYQGKSYFVTMNGQTGKIVGKRPTSVARAIGWFAGVYAGSFAIVLLILAAMMMG